MILLQPSSPITTDDLTYGLLSSTNELMTLARRTRRSRERHKLLKVAKPVIADLHDSVVKGIALT